MNLSRMSTVPGGTVQTQTFSTNQKRLGTNPICFATLVGTIVFLERALLTTWQYFFL